MEVQFKYDSYFKEINVYKSKSRQNKLDLFSYYAGLLEIEKLLTRPYNKTECVLVTYIYSFLEANIYLVQETYSKSLDYFSLLEEDYDFVEEACEEFSSRVYMNTNNFSQEDFTFKAAIMSEDEDYRYTHLGLIFEVNVERGGLMRIYGSSSDSLRIWSSHQLNNLLKECNKDNKLLIEMGIM